MDYKTKIETNPDIMLGKPVIKGTRIAVELILKRLSEGMDIEELLEAYPHITKEDVYAALSCSADIISKEEMILLLLVDENIDYRKNITGIRI